MAKVFDLDIYNGSFIDLVTSEKMIVNGTPYLKVDRGWSYFNDGTTGNYLDKSTTLNVTGGTIVYAFKIPSRASVNVGCVGITDDSGVRFESYHSGGATNNGIRLFANGEVWYTGNLKNNSHWNFVIVSFDGTNRKCYVNGIEESLTYWTTVGTQAANTIIIGKVSSVTDTLNGYINFAQIYDHVLTEAERDSLYSEWLSKTQIICPPIRNFRDSSNEININKDNLIIACQFAGINRKRDFDLLGNTLTETGCPIWKSDGLNMTNGKINVSKTFNALSSTIKVRFNFVESDQYLFRTITPGSGYIQLYLRSDNKLQYEHATDTGGSLLTQYGTISLASNKEYIIYLVYSETSFKAYLNNVEDANHTYTMVGDTINVSDINIGSYSTVYKNVTIGEFSVWDTQLNESEIYEDYNEYANQVYVYETFRKNGADEKTIYLPKGWTYNSGTYKICENVETGKTLSIGDRYLECVTNGNIGLQSSQGFGTWEFDYMKGGSLTESRIAIMGSINNIGNDTNQLGYYIHFRSDERIYFWRNSGGGSVVLLFGTGAAYFENNTWYRIKLTREVDGLFTLYIKGGLFGSSYTTVGSATDINYLNSEYFNVDLDATDRVANIKMFKGVEK